MGLLPEKPMDYNDVPLCIFSLGRTTFLWFSSSVGLWEKEELTPRQVTHARVFSLRECPSYPKTNGFAGINKTAIVQMQALLIWPSIFFKNLLLEKKPSPSWYQLMSDSAVPYVYISSPICINDMYMYVCIHICICVCLYYMYHPVCIISTHPTLLFPSFYALFLSPF